MVLLDPHREPAARAACPLRRLAFAERQRVKYAVPPRRYHRGDVPVPFGYLQREGHQLFGIQADGEYRPGALAR